MKKHRIVSRWSALAIALLSSNIVSRGVDLTPIQTTRELDGVKFTGTVFRDGLQQISYSPPPGWRLNGSGSKLTLVPGAIPNVDAQVEVKSLAAIVPINEANARKYVPIAQQSVPRDAKNVEVLGSRMNPLKICGYDTLAIELQYDAFGSVYRTHLLYLNRDREQWVFQLTAPVNTFDRAFEPFRVSLYSFAGL